LSSTALEETKIVANLEDPLNSFRISLEFQRVSYMKAPINESEPLGMNHPNPIYKLIKHTSKLGKSRRLTNKENKARQ